MSDENMIPKGDDVPEDEYHEDPNYDEANDKVDPETKGDHAEPAPSQSETNFSGSVETSLPGEAAQREDQK